MMPGATLAIITKVFLEAPETSNLAFRCFFVLWCKLIGIKKRKDSTLAKAFPLFMRPHLPRIMVYYLKEYLCKGGFLMKVMQVSLLFLITVAMSSC